MHTLVLTGIKKLRTKFHFFVPDKAAMSRYSAQILIWLIAYIFQFSVFLWVGLEPCIGPQP